MPKLHTVGPFPGAAYVMCQGASSWLLKHAIHFTCPGCLQGIYGCAHPFQLQGLMGPSGAGKSTLMDLLTMRTTRSGKEAKAAAARAAAAASMTGTAASAVSLPVVEAAQRDGVTGDLLVNGQVVSRKAFMSISAYVPQVSPANSHVWCLADACTRTRSVAGGCCRPGPSSWHLSCRLLLACCCGPGQTPC